MHIKHDMLQHPLQAGVELMLILFRRQTTEWTKGSLTLIRFYIGN